MKLKKIISLAACTIVFASCMCINVSAANTSDTQTQYVWSSSKKYDYTNARVKSDNSVVYLHPINESLPYNGFYAGTYYGTGKNNAKNKASKSEYHVGGYSNYVIRSDAATTSLKSMYVRIRGHYKDTTYSYGDCTILWSPDIKYQSGLVYLN